MRNAIRLAAAIGVAWMVYATNAQAAPVTLRFDATIQTIFPGIPFDSGIEFELGDAITGQFTFEPAVGDGSMRFVATQPYGFSLNLDGIAFSISNFEIESINDSSLDYDCPPGVTCVPPAGVIDSLVVGGDGLTAAGPTTLPNVDPAQSGFRMLLYGSASALPVASHPSDPAVWNAFNLFTALNVTLRGGSGGATGFQATVGRFVAIPEPSTFGFASLLVAAAILNRRQLALRFHR